MSEELFSTNRNYAVFRIVRRGFQSSKSCILYEHCMVVRGVFFFANFESTIFAGIQVVNETVDALLLIKTSNLVFRVSKEERGVKYRSY